MQFSSPCDYSTRVAFFPALTGHALRRTLIHAEDERKRLLCFGRTYSMLFPKKIARRLLALTPAEPLDPRTNTQTAHQAEFLRGLMVAYKEWGYQLYPGVAFEDLASRTEKLGGKARTRDLMHELRDTERDRVIEARYGREAVENVHAQEAAKLVAKESKAAAAQEEEAEELEDEQLAGSRYMEVDEERGAPASTADGGRGDVEANGDGGGNDVQTSPSLSEQVRQRMEVNRRLALERLRLKKEEAAAALETGDSKSAAGAPVVMPLDADGGDLMDLMDVDGGGAGGAEEDQFEDDEAALADMQTEEVMAPTAKSPASAGTAQQADTTAVVPSSTAAAAVSSSTSLASPLAGGSDATAAAVTCSIDSAPAAADPEDVTSAESTIIHEAAMNDEGVDSGGASDAAATAVISDGTARGAVDSATPSAADATSGFTAGIDSSEPSRAPESGEPAAALIGGEESGRGDDKGDTSMTDVAPGAHVATTADVAAVGGAKVNGASNVGDGDGAAETTVAKGDDSEQVSFSSPVKCRAASGLPLSPLGNLFASTDGPAEGGSAAVRAPLGGLFSDENV